MQRKKEKGVKRGKGAKGQRDKASNVRPTLCLCASVPLCLLLPFSFCLAAADPLEDAIGQMRTVQRRIEAGDTGRQTRELQQQIVDNLEKLIERANRQQSRPNESPQPQQQPPDGHKPDKQQQSNDTRSSGGKDQQKQNEDAKGSTDRVGKGRDHQAELLRRRQTVKEVWGHLPPALQQKLLNIFSEKYLPKYEELVRRYYEALAEQGRKQPSR